jgi:hypothetical protein
MKNHDFQEKKNLYFWYFDTREISKNMGNENIRKR